MPAVYWSSTRRHSIRLPHTSALSTQTWRRQSTTKYGTLYDCCRLHSAGHIGSLSYGALARECAARGLTGRRARNGGVPVDTISQLLSGRDVEHTVARIMRAVVGEPTTQDADDGHAGGCHTEHATGHTAGHASGHTAGHTIGHMSGHSSAVGCH